MGYIPSGIDSRPHTPVYKMHRYFARRPWNVMRALIEHYSKENDLVVDCFSGGGVTLFEGLSTRRKVIAVDVNPLACFVTDCQTTYTDLQVYDQTMKEIRKKFLSQTGLHYTTLCRTTGIEIPIRWLEHAYNVNCPKCGESTLLSNSNKAGKNGEYVCSHCTTTFASVSTPRIGSTIVSVIYTCPSSGKRVAHPPTKLDQEKACLFDTEFDDMISSMQLWYPTEEIPSNWDRQHEDSLHRKGFCHFSDLFTKRLLYHNAVLFKLMTKDISSKDPSLKKMLLFTFSAILRYTNNMLYSTPNWMDGRPVAWDKHAYWTPNQFVEVNPMEYFDKRHKAILSGLKFQQKSIKRNVKVSKFEDLVGKGTHMVVTGSSHSLEIPDNSVSAVITDPPYGSNVQYGELSHFWLVWLNRELDLELFNLEEEILVNRKKKALSSPKTHETYKQGLSSVYREMYRILEPGGIMSFTFNSKNFETWFSLIKSVLDSGFILEQDAIIYQKPIDNYKNTAHSRFDGTAQGDFIYSFKKSHKGNSTKSIANEDAESIENLIMSSIKRSVISGKQSTEAIQVQLMQDIMPALVALAEDGVSMEQFKRLVKGKSLETYLSKVCELTEDLKVWQLRDFV
jgi:putative DNA methylase